MHKNPRYFAQIGAKSVKNRSTIAKRKSVRSVKGLRICHVVAGLKIADLVLRLRLLGA